MARRGVVADDFTRTINYFPLNMKGIILAGGKGTRLYPLTLDTPKPLITVKDKPLINFSVELFAKYGIDDIAIIIRPSDREHYNRWYARYASAFPGIKIYFFEEPKAMGTLGYIFHNFHHWADGQEVFVMNGDGVVKDLDVDAMVLFHRAAGTKATVSLMKVENPGDYGSVVIHDNKVTDFLEKKEGLDFAWVSAGFYIISSSAIAHIKEQISPEQEFLMFEKDLFPVLSKAGELAAFTSNGRFFDCGTFERWEQAIREV